MLAHVPQSTGLKEEFKAQEETSLNLGITSTRIGGHLREGKMLGGRIYQIPGLWCCSGRQLLHSPWALPHSSLLSSLEWPGVHLQPAQLGKKEERKGSGWQDRLPVNMTGSFLLGGSRWPALQLLTAVTRPSWWAPTWCWPSGPSPLLSIAIDLSILRLVAIGYRPLWPVKIWAFSRKSFWGFLIETILNVLGNLGN